ncbi:sigma-70 family RNA polymerase sigma factor [Kitasatospora sp. NPDC002227]|uniref:sigma-70 family RNA polymerase sigma factor n=1 Tax=Kitasatospora sp. NPDC002227 TaxID=3154773 RepID=UPI00333461C5
MHEHDGGEAGGALLDRLGGCDPGIELAEFRAAVRPLSVELPHREQVILKLRFWDGLTQSEIARRVGVSRMHVSRPLAGVLAGLRERLDDRDAPGWSEDNTRPPAAGGRICMSSDNSPGNDRGTTSSCRFHRAITGSAKMISRYRGNGLSDSAAGMPEFAKHCPGWPMRVTEKR